MNKEKPKDLFMAIAGLKLMAEYLEAPRTKKDYEFINSCMEVIKKEVKL